MDQNPPVMAKKVYNLMRLLFFMLKKGISKSRFFTDLNLMMKRGKIAGKSLHKILFHHHRNTPSATFHHHPHHLLFPTPPPSDDEFSCTTSPQNPSSVFTTGNEIEIHAPPCNEVGKKMLTHAQPFADADKKVRTHEPPYADVDKKVLTHAPPKADVYKKVRLQTHAPSYAGGVDEIMADPGVVMAVEMLTNGGGGSASPGRSPVGRQLRITDSPFLLSNGDEDGQVDEAAEKFILKFYDILKRES